MRFGRDINKRTFLLHAQESRTQEEQIHELLLPFDLIADQIHIMEQAKVTLEETNFGRGVHLLQFLDYS